MSQAIVECIANYSEARRPEVVEAIMQAITSVAEVHLLDRHSDTDHNRTVLTYVGPPQAVQEAAFRSIARAAELINLDQHTGEHPRIGATDVCPFVPISGITMQEAVQLARELGQRVGTELGIPVYLYEEAATRPERQNLENIRRGQYEALKNEIATHPDRQPDFGPSQVGPAGATVIGARPPLVAYNVYLTTPDLSIAKKIAHAVRFSTGGMRYVKALEMLVEGRAQVSMNLTNYRGTPIYRVVEMIRREAERYGVAIHHSELVGLVPQDALIDCAQWYLQLDQFEPEQILERRLYSATQDTAPAAAPDFLDALASASPTPGGGSAAAFSGAAAAALAAMVGRVTLGKKKYADVEPQMLVLIEQADQLRQKLTQAVDQDAAAFNQVMAAFKLPKDTPEQIQKRQETIEYATLEAAKVPLEVARMALQALGLAVQAATLGNTNAISDAGSAGALARACLTGAGLNVRINAASLQNPASASPLLDELSEIEAQAGLLESQICSAIQERGGIALP